MVAQQHYWRIWHFTVIITPTINADPNTIQIISLSVSS